MTKVETIVNGHLQPHKDISHVNITTRISSSYQTGTEPAAASGEAACGSDTGSALRYKEAVAGLVGYPEFAPLPVRAGVPSRPPGLVAWGRGSGNRSRTCLQGCTGAAAGEGRKTASFARRASSAFHMRLGNLEKSRETIVLSPIKNICSAAEAWFGRDESEYHEWSSTSSLLSRVAGVRATKLSSSKSVIIQVGNKIGQKSSRRFSRRTILCCRSTKRTPKSTWLSFWPALLLLHSLHMDYSTCTGEGGRRDCRSCRCVWRGRVRRGGESHCTWRGVSMATLSDWAKESIWWRCRESRDCLPLYGCECEACVRVCVCVCACEILGVDAMNFDAEWKKNTAPKTFWGLKRWIITQIWFWAFVLLI